MPSDPAPTPSPVTTSSSVATPTTSASAPTVVETPSPLAGGPVIWLVTGTGEVHCIYYGRCFPAFVVHRGSWTPPTDWQPTDDTYEFAAGLDGLAYRRAFGSLLEAPPPAVGGTYTIALAVVEYSDAAAGCNDPCASPFFPFVQTDILCTQDIDVIEGAGTVQVRGDFDSCVIDVQFFGGPPSDDDPKQTPAWPSLTWISSSPAWGSWALNGGVAYGYEVRRCGGTGGWLILADGAQVLSRTFYTSPFRGSPDVPEWLRDESRWLKPPEPEEGCLEGWIVFVTGDRSAPVRVDWGEGKLDLPTLGVGDPQSTAMPAPTWAPTAGVAPGKPYLSADFQPWRDLEYPPPLAQPKLDSVIGDAARRIETLTGEPYWDALADFSCNSPKFCYFTLAGQLRGSTGFDRWPFVFDGSDVRVDDSDFDAARHGGEPPLQSVPADIAATARAMAEQGDRAGSKIEEYADNFLFAAWYHDRAEVVSLTYERKLTTAPTERRLTIFVNLASGQVVDIQEHDQPW